MRLYKQLVAVNNNYGCPYAVMIDTEIISEKNNTRSHKCNLVETQAELNETAKVDKVLQNNRHVQTRIISYKQSTNNK